MDTVADVVEQLTSAKGGGFDVGNTQAEKEVQNAVKRLAAESQWIKAELELGPTIADEANYVLPDNVVRLLYLTVGENTPYTRRDIRILWELKAGRDEVVRPEEGGVFGERFSEDGLTKSFDVFPVPDEAGKIVKGLCSITPAADLASGATLPFPSQSRGAVYDFAAAALYEKTDENTNQAGYYEKRALATAEALFLLGNARTGSGVYKIPVAGHRRR